MRCTVCQSYIHGTICVEAGFAASEAERKKIQKYAELELRHFFGPLAIETFGPWGPETKKLVAAVGKRLKDYTGEKRSSEFLRQRLSVEIQSRNSLSVMGTIPHSSDLADIYYVLKMRTAVKGV